MYMGQRLLDLEGNESIVVKIGKLWAYACDLSSKGEIKWNAVSRIHLPTLLIHGRYKSTPARALTAKDKANFTAWEKDRISLGQGEKSK